MRALLGVIAVLLAGCMGDIDYFDGEGGNDPGPTTEPLIGCAIECHGTSDSNAPPKSVSGAVDTTTVGVGAHQQHLDPAAWHRKVDCADCHVVPSTQDAPGHIDGDNVAELTFSMRAGTAMWNGTTCTARCHGSTAMGGTHTTPTWTQVDGAQVTCGSCHGRPPPAPHPTETNCAACHPTMEEDNQTFRDPDSHINGVVDLVNPGATGGCTACHGSAANSAPPKDLGGNTARSFAGVGAHQQHLGPSTWHRAVTCSSCHVVPTMLDSPGHRDGDNVAEIKFDTFNPMGVYTAATTTCSGLYCHGNGRGNNGTQSWLAIGPLPCTGCHATSGIGMSGDHARHINAGELCRTCHEAVVDADMNIINANLHVNGARNVRFAAGTYNAATRTCANIGCHANRVW